MSMPKFVGGSKHNGRSHFTAVYCYTALEVRDGQLVTTD